MDSAEESNTLMNKYKVGKKIGSGSFGYIYKCQNIQNKSQYAVKIVKQSQSQEKKQKGDGQLQYEIKLYQIFQGIYGMAKLQDSGFQEDKLFMIIDLLDKSLQDLFQLYNRKFSIATVYNIGLQIINRIEDMHKKGFLHRDLKANNFMVGKGNKRNIVFIIDFGLAKRYKDLKNNIHIPFKSGKSLVGTARYASIASHLGQEQGRKDDLQSLGYLLLYFMMGKLPWQGIQIKTKTQKYAEIGKLKKTTKLEQICEPLGENSLALVKFLEYVKSLSFTDEPNYQYGKNIFREQLIKMKQENKPLDWQIQNK